MTSPDASPGPTPSPDGLEARLRALGEALDTPAPVPGDVARAVRARLEQADPPPRTAAAPARRWRDRWGAAARGRGRAEPWSRWPRWRWVGTGIAVFLLLMLGLTPPGQAAVAYILRFAGIELHLGEPGPPPSGVPSPLPGETRVPLGRAREMVRFPVLVPAELGDPGEVRVSDGGRVLSMFWPGARLDAFDGTLDVVFRKDLGEPWPERVTVGPAPGWWIAGPHGLTYIPGGGGPSRTVERRAGPTLAWQRGVVGYRLEGPSDLARATRIAASLR